MDNNIEALEEDENMEQPTAILKNRINEEYTKLEDKASTS